MRSLWIVVAMLSVACVRTGTTTCADGTICRDGTICAAAGERTLCVTTEQLTACQGLTEFDACGGDRCYAIDEGLVCLPVACGNFFTDPEEQCDDGNNTSRDGCSADCFSNEQCGNEVIDSLRDERCDDGNLVSHDGCSSRCEIETSRWVSMSDRGITASLQEMGVTFDSRRGRVVMFGGREPATGSSSFFPRTTWEWDRGWFEETSLTSPEGRSETALAFDDRRGVTMLFGGLRDSVLSADTWEWSGTDWVPLDVFGPSARAGAAMAYDPVGERMVLFGGREQDKVVGDTWEFHEGAWKPIATQGPAISDNATMTFDPIKGVIALVSKRVQWELSGTTWTKIGDVPAVDNVEPFDTWLVFDVVLGQRLLLGSDGGSMVKTWAWTGQSWTELARESVPYLTLRQVVADRMRGGVIGITSTEVAVWSPTGALAKVPAVANLDIVRGGAAANDLRRHVAVVFGGNTIERGNPASRMDETHSFDGSTWTLLSPANKPSPRWGHAMVYDIARDRIVLFGGDTASGLSAETWSWDGTTWTKLGPPMSPTGRYRHAMAYDRERERIVMFGGNDASGPRDDTWEWDGTTWSPRSSAETPPARIGAALAHDPIGGGVIMFGGIDDPDFGVSLDDTWRLTSSGWARVTTALVPSGRAFSTLTWAPARQRLLLVGGDALDSSGIFVRPVTVPDTWEWDGARWRAVSTSPRLVTEHVAFFSPDGTRVTTVGGNTLNGEGAAPRHEHRWESPGSYETCTGRLDADGDGLAACADIDCWSVCTPLCLPGMTGCAAEPTCGDGTCSAIESAFTCAADCGAVPAVCGDGVCDGSETCLGDC